MPKKVTPAKKPVKAVETDKNSLLVKIVEDNTEELSTSLGITEENMDRLHKIGAKAFVAFDTISETMVEISKHCNHANELIWMGFNLGANTVERRNGSRRSEVIKIDGGKMPKELGSLIKKILERQRGKDKGSKPDEKD